MADTVPPPIVVTQAALCRAILQQSFVVDFIVETNMCMDCTRAVVNPIVWTAVVQVGSRWIALHGANRPAHCSGSILWR